MARPTLIVVTGPPASGKSTIAEELQTRLSVPALSKDEIKETIYDTIGSGPELDDAVEDAALALLFRVARRLLESDYTPVLESDFDTTWDIGRFRSLARDVDFALVQVHVTADEDVLVERFCARAESGDRHPGHDDSAEDVEELRRKLRAGLWEPLDLEGPVIDLDLTEFDVDYDDLVERIHLSAAG